VERESGSLGRRAKTSGHQHQADANSSEIAAGLHVPTLAEERVYLQPPKNCRPHCHGGKSLCCQFDWQTIF
jgi:hypothetical protein